MWILDQTNQIALNLANLSHLYIEKKTNSLKAVLLVPGEDGNTNKIHLGTYQSFEDCQRILRTIISMDGKDRFHCCPLPLGGGVDRWIDIYG